MVMRMRKAVTQRRVQRTLWLSHTLPPVATLSDTEVLVLTQVQMAPQQGHRLDRLLVRQAQGILMPQEQAELLTLMQVYQQLWIRQSAALAEAVRRGLRAPLAP